MLSKNKTRNSMCLKGSGMGFEIESSYILKQLQQLLKIWKTLDKLRDFYNIVMGMACD